MVVREVIDPLYSAWVNHGLNLIIHATMRSFSSQMGSISQVIGGLIIGLLARQVSLQAGIFTAALFPVFILFGILH